MASDFLGASLYLIFAPAENKIKGITPQREVCQYGRAVDEFLRPAFRQKGASQKNNESNPSSRPSIFYIKNYKEAQPVNHRVWEN